HRQTLRLLRLHHAFEPRQIRFQHVPIQKQDRALCLILGRSADLSVHRQMSQKRLDLCASHRGGMTLVMKKNKAFNPIRISRLSANAVMLRADFVAHLIEQFLEKSSWWITAEI